VAAPVDQYTTAIFSSLGYHATWLPGVPVAVGDVGILNRGVFEKRTSMATLGAVVSVESGKSGDFDYQSANDVKWVTKVKGELSPAVPSVGRAKAGAKIEFGRAGSVVFHLEDCRVERFSDTIAIESLMWDLWDRYIWEDEWVLVTETVASPRATILVAATGGAAVEIAAKGSATAAIGEGVLSGSIGLVSSQGMYTSYVADKGLTPLYKALGFKKGVFSGTKLQPRAAGDAERVLGQPRRRDVQRPEGRLTDEV
jgi:hypothetical protein